MALEVGLRNEIVTLLVTHPMFQDENGWRASLLSAGLQDQLPYLDLHGTPYNVIAQLVNRLDLHGTLPDGRPALGALLQAAAGQVGKDRQAHIQNLCERICVPPEVDLAACPYRGLEVFREQDADVFFGRAEVAATLQQMVAQQPLTALIGASGSGKSSVVYAGLLPLLRKQPGYLIAAFRPGAEPFRAVAATILPLLEPNLSETDRLIELRKLAEALNQEQLHLAEILDRIRQKSQPAPRLFLFADQFEELYTLCPAGASRQRFLDGMLQTSQVFKTCEVSWLLTLRADFLSQVLDYGTLAKMLDTYPPKLLGRMTEEQLRAVIEQPALKAGVTLEAGLSDHILREVGQEPGNLPLLEFALQVLWQRMTGRCLTHAAYEAIGGVNQALTRHADAVLAEFTTPEQQAQVRRIMVQLVSPGAGTEDTRQAATRDQVKDWDVVQRLADKRLVVTGRPEDSNVETVEVVHEALIRHWQPLRNWMQADRVFRVWQNNLRQAISEWEHAGQDDGAVLRGARLADAEEKLAQFADALSDGEKAYIQASVALRQQELEARERAQREKEQMRRRVTVGLIAGLLIALVLTGVSAIQWRRAQQNAQALQKQTTLAQNAAERAEQEKTRAEEQRNTTLKTQSLFLADLARQENEKQNYTNAILLALEALPNKTQPERPYVPEAEFQIYHASTNLRERRVLTGHTDAVISAVFSPDGTRIVTASGDDTARVWDVATGNELTKLTGHANVVTSVSFSPDGERIVTASSDKTVRVWNISTEINAGVFTSQTVAILTGHTDYVGSATFSPDGKRIVTASDDDTARVWDAATGKELKTLTGHDYGVNEAAFSPDGMWIVTASGDKTARVWDASTGKEVARLTGHEAAVNSAAFSPDGTRIVTAATDQTARVWDTTTGAALATLTGHESVVTSAAFSPDGTRIVTASYDKTAREWDISAVLNAGVATVQELATLTGHTDIVYSAAFSPDGTRLVTASADNTARIWAVSTEFNQIVTTLSGHTDWVFSAAFSPDGARVVTASADNTAQVWDALTGQVLATLTGHTSDVRSAAFSPNGMAVVTASNDNTAQIWDAATGIKLKALTGHRDFVISAVFSPDGTRIVTTSHDHAARVWDAATGKELATLIGHESYVTSAAFSPDGTCIVTASDDDTAQVWDAATGVVLVTLTGHEGDVTSAAFSPDGTRIVTASEDHTARVWDATTGKEVVWLTGHSGEVNSATFNPNGTRIITGTWRAARVWDAATGKEVARLTGHGGDVRSTAFSSDGTLIVIVPDVKIAQVWRVFRTTQELIDYANRIVPRRLTPDERKQYFLE